MYRLGGLLLLLATCSADSGCCPGVGCFSDSPPYDHLLLPECPEALSIETNVFTRANPVVGELLTRTRIPNVFSAKRRTVFLVHGWMSHASSHWMVDITRALLKKGDHNVVTVHWDSAQLFYPQSASDTRSVGAEVSLRVKLLVGTGGAERSDIWCVGHSLGAHVCGHAGKRIPFGRITGLDPAGPMFELYNNKAGLQKTDADFVDVIHTNGVEAIAMAMGLLKPLGHVDFYPNGGGLQPGCFIDPLAAKEENENDVSTFGDIGPACSHRRAIQLYYESITSNCKFISRMICMDPYDIPSSCRPCGDDCQTMGYGANTQPGRGLFYLETDWLAPFCLHETW